VSPDGSSFILDDSTAPPVEVQVPPGSGGASGGTGLAVSQYVACVGGLTPNPPPVRSGR
jgi:hypothetical protein